MKKQKIFVPNLGICIIMDLIGMASYIIPGWGEFSDIIWAPVSGFIFYMMFGGRFGLIGGVLDFLEEILPFTDIIPSFTIGWYIRKKTGGKVNKIIFPAFQTGLPILLRKLFIKNYYKRLATLH